MQWYEVLDSPKIVDAEKKNSGYHLKTKGQLNVAEVGAFLNAGFTLELEMPLSRGEHRYVFLYA